MLRHGFAVITTTSGNDGFRQLERSQFNCLILDGAIEGGGLLTSLACCRRYFSETKTIVLADRSLAVMQKIEMLAGANYCVSKPVDPEIIHSIISGADIGKSSVGSMH
jgi:DNA-binding response OmpR family regulator